MTQQPNSWSPLDEQSSAPAHSRNTRQRTAITSLLARSDEFFSAQQIFDTLRRDGVHLGLTTVYRVLQSLVDANIVDTVRTESGELLYRSCADQRHHHHLVCTDCGFTVEITDTTIEQRTSEIAQQYRFANIHHTLEFFGLCEACSQHRSEQHQQTLQ